MFHNMHDIIVGAFSFVKHGLVFSSRSPLFHKKKPPYYTTASDNYSRFFDDAPPVDRLFSHVSDEVRIEYQ